jgi:hypothetical protein
MTVIVSKYCVDSYLFEKLSQKNHIDLKNICKHCILQTSTTYYEWLLMEDGITKVQISRKLR